MFKSSMLNLQVPSRMGVLVVEEGGEEGQVAVVGEGGEGTARSLATMRAAVTMSRQMMTTW
jgi:hypothetical protein